MAKRCLNTMVVDGQLVTLMQISDYSILNTSGNPVMVYESSNPPDSYISEYGYDLCSFFPTALHSGEPDVYKDIEDTTAYLKQRYYYYSGIGNNDISIYSNTGTRWMGAGYAIANQDLIGFNLALVVDDDEQKAWVLGCIFLRGQYYRLWLLNDSSQYSAIYNEIKSIDGASASGGAGSGYIGNSLVSNKKMVGYNVPTSDAESTKTESINEASESPVSGKPKIGNGYAKIKLLREYPTPPSNYLVDIEPQYGLINLVTQYPLDTSRLTGVAIQDDYFYRADLVGSTIESAFFVQFGGKFNITGKLIFETEVYMGNEDANTPANPDWVISLHDTTYNYQGRIIEVTYRNHNFETDNYPDYFYYYSNSPLGSLKAPMDYAEYYNKFTHIKFEFTLNSGMITELKCYRDGELFRNSTLSINIAQLTIPYIKMAIPSAGNKQPVTQRIKYFKVYTET